MEKNIASEVHKRRPRDTGNEGPIKERWKEYLSTQFNECGEKNITYENLINKKKFIFYRHICSKEVKQVMYKIGNDKAIGQDTIDKVLQYD